MSKQLIIGRLEKVHLPELSIYDLTAKIDTGAKTSSIHVDNIRRVVKNHRDWVEFEIHPDIYDFENEIKCSLPIFDSRLVKSSNGVSEERIIVETEMHIGNIQQRIELSLTNRKAMKYLMLIGRQAMGKNMLVSPSQQFLASDLLED